MVLYIFIWLKPNDTLTMLSHDWEKENTMKDRSSLGMLVKNSLNIHLYTFGCLFNLIQISKPECGHLRKKKVKLGEDGVAS